MHGSAGVDACGKVFRVIRALFAWERHFAHAVPIAQPASKTSENVNEQGCRTTGESFTKEEKSRLGDAANRGHFARVFTAPHVLRGPPVEHAAAV